MTTDAITSENLSFGYPGETTRVLNNINLKVEKGSIYGFLGPNGAGKTTTIRLLLGLLPAASGVIKLFGKHRQEKDREVFGRLGAFIESPSLYEHLTGYENLRITQKLKNADPVRISETLEEVGLASASRIKVKRYSFGMKQRLGLAIALLSRPELLILDEPTNGLDPNGINEIRELLLGLNRQYGTTVFVSSHLLAEIEKMATHLGIIHRGSLVFQGKLDELIEHSALQNMLRIQTSDNKLAATVLKPFYIVGETGNGILEVAVNKNDQADHINKLLVHNSIRVFQLYYYGRDLEKIYLSITQQ